MTVLGIDLATRRYRDIGLVLVDESSGALQVKLVRPGWSGTPTVTALAGLVAELAQRQPLSVIAIDGPQAWKAEGNGLVQARCCEKLLNTQAKTGLPGRAKPATALRFVEFAIAFFDALAALGWPRLADPATNPAIPVAIEVWPTAAWRALGLRPLPAKRATAAADVADWLAQLQNRLPLRLPATPTHDELQAILAGLVGLALVGSKLLPPPQFYGTPPMPGVAGWCEGYMLNFARLPGHNGG
jgi:hypothetical protein